MLNFRSRHPKRRPSRFSLALAVAVLSAGACIAAWSGWSLSRANQAPPGDLRIQQLIDKAVAARDRAYESIRSARGKGIYETSVTEKDGNTKWALRSTFQMVFDHPRDLIQFRFAPGAEPRPDCHARVVVSDGKHIFDALYPDTTPDHVECARRDVVSKGVLQPVVWISPGYLAKYYAFVHLARESIEDVSLRDEGNLRVVKRTSPDGSAAEEFWINPAQDFHIVRYRFLNYANVDPIAVIDVSRQWQKTGRRWFVKQCTYRGRYHRNGDVYQTETFKLVFDSFEPDVDIPPEVFTIHALGLPDGTTIRDRQSGEELGRYDRDPEFDCRKVERFVGKLPASVRDDAKPANRL